MLEILFKKFKESMTSVLPVAVLRQGSKSSEVKEVQRRLKKWGYYTGAVDGVFGQGTRNADPHRA